MIDRRVFLVGAAAAFSGCAGRRTPAPAVEGELADLGLRLGPGGRLGIAAWDGGKRRLRVDADSRYAMASTFKAALAGAVLEGVDQDRWSLADEIPFGPADLVPYAPVVESALAGGRLSVERLAAAIVEVSDNVAANLLLRLIGGPAVFTAFCRRCGDSLTRLDRFEPALNSNLPADPRDTTTPAAMLGLMRTLLFEGQLATASQRRLQAWMEGVVTGRERLRAGFPSNWRVGDKTGTGANGATNDIAFAVPPGRRPTLVTVYMSGGDATAEQRNAIHAEIARMIAAWA